MKNLSANPLGSVLVLGFVLASVAVLGLALCSKDGIAPEPKLAGDGLDASASASVTVPDALISPSPVALKKPLDANGDVAGDAHGRSEVSARAEASNLAAGSRPRLPLDLMSRNDPTEILVWLGVSDRTLLSDESLLVATSRAVSAARKLYNEVYASAKLSQSKTAVALMRSGLGRTLPHGYAGRYQLVSISPHSIYVTEDDDPLSFSLDDEAGHVLSFVVDDILRMIEAKSSSGSNTINKR